jgi:hypothetical protein
MDQDEIRFSFLADDYANKYGYRLVEPMALDPETQNYTLLFVKFPHKQKQLLVPRDMLLQCVTDDRLTPELVQQMDRGLGLS